eukprot:Nitzschia sp. Nitz4//scaffold51_size120721//48291//50340//NITZ4_003725-RA/size120721-processed-gene-0.122-mRNA-1//1//CDS//3329553856//7299//frame0
MSARSLTTQQQQYLMAGLASLAAVGLLTYLVRSKPKAPAVSKGGDDVEKPKAKSLPVDASTVKASNTKATKDSEKKTKQMAEQALHAKIEELDKTGKQFFKAKQFLDAAQSFSEALALIEEHADHADTTPSTSLNKQIVTLINNRSAMYEKGNFPELALEDCSKILEVYDKSHVKARTRKLRLLEVLGKFEDALIEFCAIQLLYMQQNRSTIRMGLQPATPPPVPQSKLEELLAKVLPGALDAYVVQLEAKSKDVLPPDYTLMQLLKSYTGYNAWMSEAASAGTISKLQEELDALPSNKEPTTVADRASLMLKMGRRYVFDAQYEKARVTFLDAYKLVKDQAAVRQVMKDDDYPRLLEWVGMVKHWTYDLEAAMACYQECSELEPLNFRRQAEVLVKKAGVAMDDNKHEQALKLFDKALIIDPNAADALLHRANLRMLQTKLDEAQVDLERCLELRPNHVLARLRLVAILTSKQDINGAKKHLTKAERVDPKSSEVQSYRGELLFTQNEFAEAKQLFDKAIKLEPKNPLPYVNAALAVLNTPPQPGKQMEMAAEAIALLEKAISVDPQFQAAYVQLGQLKLGMASDLTSAREVLALYEKGLSYCRKKEEMKDLCSMKLLTQAQVDAASMLKMETFSMN